MYYKQSANVIYRDYGDFGYITDNRNFGYRPLSHTECDIGDRIVSKSGNTFLSVLRRNPQTLEKLAEKIFAQFCDVDIEQIKKDAECFYSELESSGFVVSGTTQQECIEKDNRFSCQTISAVCKDDSGSSKHSLKRDTQDFFNSYFKGNPQLTNLHLEITSKCNERCIHCYIPHENKIQDIKSQMFYDILEQCRKMNVLHLTISGGEPMSHPDFLAFLRKCNEYNFSVNVLSNLTLLDTKIINEMKQNPLLSVQVSLYSMDAGIHDMITRREGSFERTKNAILKLVENHIPLQISCPILKQNMTSYRDVINWGRQHDIHVGTDYVIIGRYDHTTENLCNRLSLCDVEQITRENIEVEPEWLEKTKKEMEAKGDMSADDSICSVCRSSICITETGNVYPCAGWQDFTLGNIKEESLGHIWNDSERVHYLRDLKRGDFVHCLDCPDRKFCTMCMVRNANEDPSGDPLTVNRFYCSVAKMNKELYYAARKN